MTRIRQAFLQPSSFVLFRNQISPARVVRIRSNEEQRKVGCRIYYLFTYGAYGHELGVQSLDQDPAFLCHLASLEEPLHLEGRQTLSN